MEISTAKQLLETKKTSLTQELAVIQTALDALDEKIAITFPNLDVVVAERGQAIIDKEAETKRADEAEALVEAKTAEITALKEVPITDAVEPLKGNDVA